MTQKEFTVNKSLDAREVAFFVQTASAFESKVTLKIGDKIINAKSIMGAISINISKGQEAVIYADGVDESEAAEKISAALQ